MLVETHTETRGAVYPFLALRDLFWSFLPGRRLVLADAGHVQMKEVPFLLTHELSWDFLSLGHLILSGGIFGLAYCMGERLLLTVGKLRQEYHPLHYTEQKSPLSKELPREILGLWSRHVLSRTVAISIGDLGTLAEQPATPSLQISFKGHKVSQGKNTSFLMNYLP